MKVCGEGKCLFGILTLDDLDVIQGQSQKCLIFTA